MVGRLRLDVDLVPGGGSADAELGEQLDDPLDVAVHLRDPLRRLHGVDRQIVEPAEARCDSRSTARDCWYLASSSSQYSDGLPSTRQSCIAVSAVIAVFPLMISLIAFLGRPSRRESSLWR